ncbi:MAG: hypothetical protein KBC33_00355 [Candidatus Pacebacteria bacterium]|nr:hypothetical protein [Candidatus Paceibacterota bacterium]
MLGSILLDGGLQFQKKELFLELRTSMKRYGLHLFSEAVIDHTDATYHVPSRFARVTSQFYWCERKQLIIVLTHTEDTYGQGENPRYVRGYWQMRAYLGFLPSFEQLTALAPGKDISKIPFFEGEIPETFTPKGLYYNGGSYSGAEKLIEATYSFDTKFDCTNVVGITAAAVELKTATEKYLRRLPFAELWVYSFPPSYVFKGCEKTFWDRFDKRNLRSLVVRPYGSDGLKR